MKESLRISLIIAAYNEERYIGDCLSAVFQSMQQTGKSFHEIIVVDNASTDKTAEIARTFPGVTVVFESKKGVTNARQCGFVHSTGDIIAVIDADTRMPIGWYEKIEEAVLNTPDMACISGPYNYYDIPAWRNSLVRTWYFLAIPFYLMTGYMLTGGNFAIKRDVLEKMGGFDTSIRFYGEDTNTARRAHQYGKVLFHHTFSIGTSARRFEHQGLLKTAYLYGTNFLWEVFFHKPRHNTYADYR